MLLISQLSPLAALTQNAVNPAEAQARFHEMMDALGLSNPLVLAAVLAGQWVFTIFIYWIASKAVASSEFATIGNAIKLWFFYLLSGLATGVVLFIALFVLGHTQSGALAVGVGALFLILFVCFIIPMKTYEIGFFRALGFLLLVFLIAVVGSGIFGAVLSNQPEVMKKLTALSMKNRAFFLRKMAGKPATEEIDRLLDDAEFGGGEKRTLPERQARIREIYEKLEATHRALVQTDLPAVETYQNRRTRYENVLAQLKSDALAEQNHPPSSSGVGGAAR